MTLDGGNDTISGAELREHLEALPQELYDYIYDLTFSAKGRIQVYRHDRGYGPDRAPLPSVMKHYSERVVAVNEKPSHLLHVDRASRQKFAQSYYGHPNSTFIFSNGFFPIGARPFMRLMKDVRLIVWHDFAALNSARKGRIARWAGIPAEGIRLITFDDIAAFVKRVGDGQEAASGVTDLTI